jgi:hypothetical protein
MKILKTLLLLISITALLLTFVGCDATFLMSAEDKATYNKTVEKGEKIVKEYVEENMPDYKIVETICVQDEPSGGMYGEPSIYSSSKCINKKNNSTINLLCNTETGELFSDEYVEEIKEELLEYFEDIVDSKKYKKRFSIFPADERTWLDYGSVLVMGDTTLEDVLNNERYSLALRMCFFDAEVEKIHSIPDTFVEECKINDLNISIVTTKDTEYYMDFLNSWSIWDPYDGGKTISREIRDDELIIKSENFFENEKAR